MNKKVIIAEATAAAASVAGLAIYISRDPLEVAFQYNTTKDFRLPEFVPAQGFAAEQVRDIERQVCGGVGS